MHNYLHMGIYLLMYMHNSLHIHGTCAYLSVDVREMFMYIVEPRGGACSPQHSAMPLLWGQMDYMNV